MSSLLLLVCYWIPPNPRCPVQREGSRPPAWTGTGIFCAGCCWALMLVMFAVGAANLVWMAVLAALMVHEKTRTLGALAVPITGIALLGVASVTLVYSACRAAGIV